MKVEPGFYDPATGAGVETLICTPSFGQSAWVAKHGYLRLKALGTVQVQVWTHNGAGWDNHGLQTITRDGGCASWPITCHNGNGGSALVWRVRKTDDVEAGTVIDACIEELPA